MKHIPHGRTASILACELRELSHEDLVALAANAIVCLKRTADALEYQINDGAASASEGLYAADTAREFISSTCLSAV